MNPETREVLVPPAPSEAKIDELEKLTEALETDFGRIICAQNGLEYRRPDDFSEYYDDTVLEESAVKIDGSQSHPVGDLVRVATEDGETLVPANVNGPLADIFELQLGAKDLFEFAGNEQTGQQKINEFLTQARLKLADIFNGYGGERDNQDRLLLKAIDFIGLYIRQLAGTSLLTWRSRLTMHKRQNQYPYLFESANELARSKHKLQTPNIADRYLLSYFVLRSNPEDTHRLPEDFNPIDLDGQALSNLDQIFSIGPESYRAISDIFFGGNMQKAYTNLSALTKMTGRRMPKGYRQFHGTTTELQQLRGLLPELTRRSSSTNCYVEVADSYFAGDMKKAYINVSAAAKMTGQEMPQGWRTFVGSTAEFRQLNGLLPELSQRFGAEGYLEVSDTYFDGAMHKAYTNVSAVAKMTGQEMPRGWQAFQGSTVEFRRLSDLLPELALCTGAEGCIKTADTYFGGDMLKAYRNVSAVAKMTGQEMPRGWQAFQGSTVEFRQLCNLLPKLVELVGAEGYIEVSDTYFGGNMFKAYRNISAAAKMSGQEMPQGWQTFSGSTAEYKVESEYLESGGEFNSFQSKFYPNDKRNSRTIRENYLAIKNMIAK